MYLVINFSQGFECRVQLHRCIIISARDDQTKAIKTMLITIVHAFCNELTELLCEIAPIHWHVYRDAQTASDVIDSIC